MISGDSLRRNSTILIMADINDDNPTQYVRQQKALGFTCLDYESEEGALARHALPEKSFLNNHCPRGIRLELVFPSCWNGIDIANSNHKNHVTFPTRVQEGDCPRGFPIRLPVLYYETIWNTYQYRDIPGKFVLSNGDETGFGYHGDFMSAWNNSLLQHAIKTCRNTSGLLEDCQAFQPLADLQTNQCKFRIPGCLINEDIRGPRHGLPGNVTVSGVRNHTMSLGHPLRMRLNAPETYIRSVKLGD